jgi:hypothetical protein
MLLLWCGFVCVQQRADASCGDYLQMGTAHSSNFQSPAEIGDGRLPALPVEPRRCHGPGCSQSPGIPVNHISHPLKSPQIKVYVIVTRLDLESVAVQKAFGTDRHLESSGLGSSIFRPPCVS